MAKEIDNATKAAKLLVRMLGWGMLEARALIGQLNPEQVEKLAGDNVPRSAVVTMLHELADRTAQAKAPAAEVVPQPPSTVTVKGKRRGSKITVDPQADWTPEAEDRYRDAGGRDATPPGV